MSRAKRVLEHEQRTSLSMFATDMVDGPENSSTGVPSTAFLTPPQMHLSRKDSISKAALFRSKSLPCTPKASRKSRRSNFGGASPHHSPKSVLSSSSKFSLSSSLLAVHRQASTSLRAELLKLEHLGKFGGSASKTRSLQSSIKLRKNRSHSSINKEENLSQCSEDEHSNTPTSSAFYVKKPIQESRSLPALKISRMAAPHQENAIAEELVNASEEADDGWSFEFNETSASSSHVSNYRAIPSTSAGDDNTLPDLIPRDESKQEDLPQFSQVTVSTGSGVINLGFDGNEESSDFATDDLQNNEDGMSSDKKTIQVPGMSLGIAKAQNSNVSGFDLPSVNVTVTQNTYHGVYTSEEPQASTSGSEWSIPSGSSDLLSAGSTARCSPSYPPATEEFSFNGNITLQVPQHVNAGGVPSIFIDELKLQKQQVGVTSGQLKPRPVRPMEAEETSDKAVEEPQPNNMDEARAMVYWWEKEAADGEQYCLREGKCSKKVRAFFIYYLNIKKKLLLAAFYHLTYQHDSKDFNICNYNTIYINYLEMIVFLPSTVEKQICNDRKKVCLILAVL